ncbi:MAG: hypothetical protein ACP5H2_08160 [Solirubrobacteraceae bacterium]
MGAGRQPVSQGGQQAAHETQPERQDELAPYRQLVKLVEHELELAGRGQLGELSEAVVRTGAYLDTLPVPPPQSARALIERTRAIRARVAIETQRLGDALTLQHAYQQQRRRLARSYTAKPSQRYSASA